MIMIIVTLGFSVVSVVVVVAAYEMLEMIWLMMLVFAKDK